MIKEIIKGRERAAFLKEKEEWEAKNKQKPTFTDLPATPQWLKTDKKSLNKKVESLLSPVLNRSMANPFEEKENIY
jgi:negative regulator of replication initiation